MGGIEQLAHFELLKAQPEHEVTRSPFEGAKTIPAGERSSQILIADLRRADVLEYVRRFIAVILGYVRGAATAAVATAAAAAATAT